MRFGNKAFKVWIAKIRETIHADITEMCKAGNPDFKNYESAVPELSEYLIESFGNDERIDYGTGHEMNFYIFMYCMCKINIYNVHDYKELINKVF